MRKIFFGLFLGTLLTTSVSAFGLLPFARRYGGTADVVLDEGEKLEYASWKGDDLWMMIRERRQGEIAETHVYREKSSWGIVQGKVIIQEK